MRSQGQSVLCKPRLALVLVLLGTMAPLGGDVTADSPSYPLMCRGGGDMTIQVYYPPAADNLVSIKFGKALNSAGTSPPGPGQCAWLDRPLSEREPAELVWQSSDIKNVGFTLNARGQLISYIPNGRGGDRVRYLIDNVLNGRVFQVHARSQWGSLHITRVGP